VSGCRLGGSDVKARRSVWMGRMGKSSHFFEWEDDTEALCGVKNSGELVLHKTRVFRCHKCLKLYNRYRK